MSLNELILDKPKPWLRCRVEQMSVDGSLIVDNTVTSGLQVSGTSFLNGGVEIGGTGDLIDQYDTRSLTTAVSGSFVVTGFNIAVVVNRLGPRVTMKIPAFTILNANQTASGDVFLSPALPLEFQPTDNCDFAIVSRDTAGIDSGTKLRYQQNINSFQLFDAYANNFTKAGGDIGPSSAIYISWIV